MNNVCVRGEKSQLCEWVSRLIIFNLWYSISLKTTSIKINEIWKLKGHTILMKTFDVFFYM